jgi:hypothetical protein
MGAAIGEGWLRLFGQISLRDDWICLSGCLLMPTHRITRQQSIHFEDHYASTTRLGDAILDLMISKSPRFTNKAG